MRGVYVGNRPWSGSRYKFQRMFEQVCDLDTVFDAKDLRRNKYQFAIVEGDKRTDYKHAIRAELPYILIQHDTWTIRAGRESKQEREMVEKAACVLFTSPEHFTWMDDKYDLPKHRTVALRPLAEDLDFEPLPKLEGKHLVYAGGIVTPEGADGNYGYRCYHEIFSTLIDAGWTVHVYPAWHAADRAGTYKDIGCVIHDEVPQADLYRELSQYTVGFQGYAETGPQVYVKGCRPNKLWEYLAAGIPTVGYNTGDGGSVYDGKWGTVAKTLKGLPAAANRAAKMTITDEMRREQVMDNDIAKFEGLVSIALEAGPQKVYILGIPVDFRGVHYPKGSPIPAKLAFQMKADGVIEGRNL